MLFETWLTFISVVFIFAIIPGPTVIMVIGQAIKNGKKSVIPLVSGVLAGDFVAMSLSIAGLGAILAASATLYAILKWFGILYLIYLGIKVLLQQPNIDVSFSEDAKLCRKNLFRSSFLVTALNPKDIIFFVAFLPQFVNPHAEALPQLLILMVSFLGVIAITISLFALFSGSIRQKIQTLKAQKNLNRLSGGALIGAGVFASTIDKQ